MKYKAIVIGASSGGMNALKKIVMALPPNFDMPVIIIQHIGAGSDSYWIDLLDDICKLKVKEADEKEKIKKGTVYVAPPNYHLLVETDETFSLTIDQRVNYARPSIDVLFESAAHVYKDKLIGIILTGSNSDGALGMKKIKDLGGLTISEDPKTAESAFMPASAIEITKIDHILPMEKIIQLLLEINNQL